MNSSVSISFLMVIAGNVVNSPQVISTFLSIITNPNDAVVGIVSTLSRIPDSSNLASRDFGTMYLLRFLTKLTGGIQSGSSDNKPF